MALGDHSILKRLLKLMIKFERSGYSEQFQKTLDARPSKPPRHKIKIEIANEDGENLQFE